MRVVVDTNVLVSSFFGGKPREVIELWKKGKVTLCVSSDILDEYIEVVQRLGLDSELVVELVTFFAHAPNVLFVAQTESIKVVESDPEDDKFFGCALALNAETIITGDKAMLAIGSFRGIDVERPAEFLNRLAGNR